MTNQTKSIDESKTKENELRTITKPPFNLADGNELMTIDECMSELKATLKEDPEMYFWVAEHHFWNVLDKSDGFDIDVVQKSYRLYKLFNSIMIAALD